MKKFGVLFDIPTIVVILLTLGLFIVSLFVKGFTHDLLLESGVFLVSTKLILMSFANKKSSEKIIKEISEIKDMINQLAPHRI
jgi:hypothetical protein